MFVTIVIGMLMLLNVTSSCKRNPNGKGIFVEHIKPVPEVLLPLLDCYTSGVIGMGEPIQVSFTSADILKKQYGEDLPSKLFTFQPNLKGSAYWIDDHSVGFQYDDIDCNQQYVCSFKASELVDVPDDAVLEFGFTVRKQNFSLVSVLPDYKSSDLADFTIRLAFTNAIGEDEALTVFDDDFINKYHPESVSSTGKVFDFLIKDIARQDKDFTIPVNLDGTKLNSASKASEEITVLSSSDFSVVQVIPDSDNTSLKVYFSQPLDKEQNLDGFLEFNHEVGYTSDIYDNAITIYFDKTGIESWFENQMTVTVKEGIRSDNGKTLLDSNTFDFGLATGKPKVRWTNEGNIVPDIADPTVYFDAVGVNEVTLRIIRIFDNNLLSFIYDNGLEETYGVRKAGRLEKKVRLKVDNPSPLQWKTFPIVLSNYIDVKPGAMYQLSLDFGPEDYVNATDKVKSMVSLTADDESGYWEGEEDSYKKYQYDESSWDDPMGLSYYNDVEVKKNVVVSDLAVTAKMGRTDVADVFVYNISDATPAKAQIKAYDLQQQEVADGKTDADGHLLLKCATRPFFIVAADSKGSRSIIRLENGDALSYSKFDIEGETVEKGLAAFAYSNRGVWRPGDELQLNIMLSDNNTELPEGYPVVLEVYDAMSRLYARQSKTSPNNGIYCFNVPTNAADETGVWQAKFKVGSNVITKYLRVETIKPNRLEINFALPELISARDGNGVALSSKWLNGLKATGLKANVDVKISAGETSFKSFKNYTFENVCESFSTQEVALFSGPLGDDGVVNIGFSPLAQISANEMLNAVFSTKVFEPSGDFSITSTKTRLSPCRSYVGVELPKTSSKYGSYYDTGKDWNFNIAVINENGSMSKTNTTLEYHLYKLDYSWWWSSEDSDLLQRYASGTYKRPYSNGTLSCTGHTSLRINIPDKDWGYYLLIIEDNVGGNVFAKVIDFDWGSSYMHASSATDAPVELSMKATKDSYQVGEDVVVTFPANEKARALVTVESSDKVIQSMVIDKLGEEGKVVFKATQDMIPNVYVYVALIQPHDAGNDMPIRLYGVVPVKVENQKLQLKPVMSVPETSNTNKKIQVKVSETNGKPMSYTIAVVDEGILDLTSFSTPDPYKYFNSKRALAVRTWDNYVSVIDAFTGDLGSVYAIGGDGLINQEITLDKRFKAYSVTYGPFELAAGKTNTLDFEVPQCSGSLRFMVVAKGEGKSFGSAEKEMKVIDPITLYPSAPRVVAPGDELTLNVQVLSPLLKGKTATVKVQNTNLATVGALPNSVNVDAQGEGMITMKVKVPEVMGTAKMKVTVSGGGHEVVSETEMPIRMPYSERRQNVMKEIPANQSVSIPFDMNCISGSQSGKVVVSGLVPVNLYGRLDYLESYPYGCLEQVVSKAFPLLYVNNFVQQDEADVAKMKETVNSVISDIKAYQRPDFTLTTWPGGKSIDEWTGVYTLHFLVEAKKQGFNVPQHLLDGLVKHQTATAKTWRNDSYQNYRQTIQAYRLFVLALAKSPEMGAMNRFKEMEMEYPLTKILAAAAFAQTGKTTIAQKLLPNISGSQPMSDYSYSYGSDVRDLAFATYTMMLCDVGQQKIQANINAICKVLNSDRWLDTQSTSFALFVLGKYAEKNKVANAKISASVTINGDSHAVNANIGSASVPFVPKKGGNEVKVKNNSGNKVMAMVYTKASYAEYERKESGAGLKMTVNYVGKDGSPINVASMTAGTDFNAIVKVVNTGIESISNMALSYYVPSGWEIVSDRLSDAMGGNVDHYDVRDDRVCYYFSIPAQQSVTFKLQLNATYKGKFTIPAVHCENMYDDQIYYVVPARNIEVK